MHSPSFRNRSDHPMSDSTASDNLTEVFESIKLAHETPSNREKTVDLAGVLIVIGLTFFHGAMPYAGIFYIPETNANEFFFVFMGVFVLWAMPLLFYNAGRATWYNLGKRNVKEFIWERTKRLLIPFIVGTILFSPLLAWIALTNLVDNPLETFLDAKSYFTIVYPEVFNITVIFQNFPVTIYKLLPNNI